MGKRRRFLCIEPLCYALDGVAEFACCFNRVPGSEEGGRMMELKPCPFCGSRDVKVYAYQDGGICVKCLDCYCQTQPSNDFCISDAKKYKSAFEKSVEAWNRRVTDVDNH